MGCFLIASFLAITMLIWACMACLHYAKAQIGKNIATNWRDVAGFIIWNESGFAFHFSYLSAITPSHLALANALSYLLIALVVFLKQCNTYTTSLN